MSDITLDVDEFMDRVQNDKELFFELLDIFVNDFHIKRQALEVAINEDDHETIEHVSHFLKGSCGNISAGPLRAIFSELEKRGRAREVTGIVSYLEDIDKKFSDLMIVIGDLRTKS